MMGITRLRVNGPPLQKNTRATLPTSYRHRVAKTGGTNLAMDTVKHPSRPHVSDAGEILVWATRAINACGKVNEPIKSSQ